MLLTPFLPGPHQIPDFTYHPTTSTVASGDWDDSSIWSTGVVPQSSDIAVISSGHSVSLNDDVDVQAIGIHGKLTSSATFRVNVVVVYEDGALDMRDGTDLVIADHAINPVDDPLQWGNSLIVQGTWTADGVDKAPYVRATADIPAGATSFTADVIPVGWEVGDILALPETAQTVVSKEGGDLKQSELVTIASIDGNKVHFTTAAKFDHNGISPNPFSVERFAHVANLTRPIVIRSENPDGVRGHTVATHRAQVDLDDIAFIGLGRTSANRPIDDARFSDTGELIHVGENQSGRYSFHTHHLHGSYTLSDAVVNDAEKWGVTIHQTNNGVVSNTVVYDVVGAGIVTEGGDEIDNRFVGNLVIKVDGGYQTGDSRGGVKQVTKPDGRIVDIGADGSGFWFRGPGSFVENNFVYDANGYGFNFNGYYRKEGEAIQIRSFLRNEVVASRGGLWATWSQLGSQIGTFGRQEFRDLLVWHASHAGVWAYHDANITLENVTVIGNPNTSSANEGSHFIAESRSNVGLQFGNGSYENHNLILSDVKVSGMNLGLLVPVHAGSAGALLDGGHFQNYVNIAFLNGAKTADLAIRNVAFSPTYVNRVSSITPDSPADIWHESLGVLKSGAAASGSSGADGTAPLNLPNSVKLLDDGRLKITGGTGADIVFVNNVGIQIELSVNGTVTLIDRSSVKQIWFIGNDGDDEFENNTSIPTLANGGSGDDTLSGGSANDQLNGGAGNDLLVGNAGNDVIYGEDGNDVMHGGDGSDKIRGGDGNDLIFGGEGADPILSGGGGNDRIDGGEGDDRIYGGDGDDALYGGVGHDSINGNAGNDVLIGESGNDVLYGGSGDDELLGGGGVNKYRPEEGRDLVFSSIGDILFTGVDDVISISSDPIAALAHFGENRLIQFLVGDLLMTELDAAKRALASTI